VFNKYGVQKIYVQNLLGGNLRRIPKFIGRKFTKNSKIYWGEIYEEFPKFIGRKFTKNSKIYWAETFTKNSKIYWAEIYEEFQNLLGGNLITCAMSRSQDACALLRGARELGRSAHAVVLLRKNACGSDIAVKHFRTGLPALEDFAFATDLLVHKHVVLLLTLDDTEGWLSMEAVDCFALDIVLEHFGLMQEQQIVAVLSDVTAGLAAFHAHGVPHCDVKPGNIMQDRRTARCKLIDWIGHQEERSSLRMGMQVGTPVFMATEVAGVPHTHCVESDTWSLGCTVLNLSSGKLPWANADKHGPTNEFMAMCLAAQGQAPPHDYSQWTRQMRVFVARCFEPDKQLHAKQQSSEQTPFSRHCSPPLARSGTFFHGRMYTAMCLEVLLATIVAWVGVWGLVEEMVQIVDNRIILCCMYATLLGTRSCWQLRNAHHCVRAAVMFQCE
jgi:hypothetical protein